MFTKSNASVCNFFCGFFILWRFFMVRKAVMDDFPVILNIYATARAFYGKNREPDLRADGHPSADLLRECISHRSCLSSRILMIFRRSAAVFILPSKTIRLMHRSQRAAGYPMPLTGGSTWSQVTGRCTDFCESSGFLRAADFHLRIDTPRQQDHAACA